jgi:regulator of replication initiation timing
MELSRRDLKDAEYRRKNNLVANPSTRATELQILDTLVTSSTNITDYLQQQLNQANLNIANLQAENKVLQAENTALKLSSLKLKTQRNKKKRSCNKYKRKYYKELQLNTLHL